MSEFTTPAEPDTEDPDEWTGRVRAAVRTVAGDGFTDGITALWNRFEHGPDVRVTVYGPYDAGKSSLIRRLLAEDGTEAPAWLTVSARRETFTVDHVRSAGLEYADTPGIAGGNEEHRAAADNALSLTDALLVVLPPQLATTDAGHLRDVATGALFGPAASRLFPRGALRLVVGRMDEAGVDPRDDPDAYRGLCAHKRKELATLLARGADDQGRDDLPIHLVAADPYGFALFAATSDAGAEGAGGDWDGIAELRSGLAGLAGRRAELRPAAEVRLWSRIATRTLDEAERERAAAAEAAGEARRELAQLDAVVVELDGLVAAAAAELRAAVHELLNSAVDTLHGADLDHVRAQAERGLGDALTAWSARWGGELDRLVRQTDGELATRARRAAATAFHGFVGSLGEPPADRPASPAGNGESGESEEQALGRALRAMSGSVREVVRSLYQSHLEKDLGMPLDRARLELGHVERLIGDQRKLRHYYGSGIGFADGRQTAAARTALQRMKIFETVLPSMLELGELAFQEIRGRRLEDQESRRRTALRGKLDETAGAIVDRILTAGEDQPDFGWNRAVVEVREGLEALARPLRSLAGVLEARQATLAAGGAELTALLAQAPARRADAG
ncbi:hypothetical protein GCM10009639_69340 [Kitasatospora putterlickiae]|uniref:G domain-containing protein n=1 Tax=Kitasatospora putterlickiae TaxID=221725 RepID=A0ABP4JBI6_9ACTN